MWYRRWSIVLDISALILAFTLALYIRFNNLSMLSRSWYVITFIILLTLDFLILYFKGLYDKKHKPLFNQIGIVIDGLVYSAFIYLLISYFTKMTYFSRLTLIYIFIIGLTFQITFKTILSYLQKRRYKKGLDLSNALVIGDYTKIPKELMDKLKTREYGINIVGYLSNDINGNGLNRLGSIKNFSEVIDKYNVEMIFIVSKVENVEEVINIGLDKYISIYSINNSINLPNYPMEIEIIDNMPILKLKDVFISGFEGHMKRLLDFTLSLIALIILSPLFIIISLLIKITSPGPVFFKHKRLGLNGKLIEIYKFRTMVVNAQEILDKLLSENPELKKEYEATFKLKNDPRITKIGKFLRKTSLDELPQLFNVLKGELSLVGPRPIVLKEINKYGEYGKYLLRVPPGITGLWQISGRNDVDYEERVEMDMQYISNWNLWLDINILFKTIPAVLKRDGAY